MMWRGDWSGADWVWMSVLMVMFWAALIVGGVWVARSVGRRRGARDIPDERYVRGELSDEEYRTRREAISRA